MQTARLKRLSLLWAKGVDRGCTFVSIPTMLSLAPKKWPINDDVAVRKPQSGQVFPINGLSFNVGQIRQNRHVLFFACASCSGRQCQNTRKYKQHHKQDQRLMPRSCKMCSDLPCAVIVMAAVERGQKKRVLPMTEWEDHYRRGCVIACCPKKIMKVHCQLRNPPAWNQVDST